jgi:hypothetical protein
MRDKLRIVAASAAAGATIGVFWIFAGKVFGTHRYWSYWSWQPKFVNWIVYLTCPFAELDINRSAFVVVPLLNAILYSLLVYVILRFAKRPAILTAFILGYAVGVFWVILTDAAMSGYLPWLPNWVWWGRITCPFAYLLPPGLVRIGLALIPLATAICYLLVYTLLRRIYRIFWADR